MHAHPKSVSYSMKDIEGVSISTSGYVFYPSVSVLPLEDAYDKLTLAAFQIFLENSHASSYSFLS